MKYTIDIEIGLPREAVVDLFMDQRNLPEWQPHLLRLETGSGTPGAAGTTTKMTYQMGPKQVEMVETIEAADLPGQVVMVYESGKVWNRCVNRFVEVSPEKTRWEMASEFRCSGMMKILTTVNPGMFKKQSIQDLERFKAFAESR